MTAKHLTKRLICLNQISDEFWRLWWNEYMLELRDAHRYGAKTSMNSAVAVGDVVLVHVDSKPSGFWRIARVQDLIQVKVPPEGKRGFTKLQRPLETRLKFAAPFQTRTENLTAFLRKRTNQRKPTR